jgi:Phage P22-like portal protein
MDVRIMAQDPFQKARERYQDSVDAFAETRKRMVEDLKFSNPADPQQWDQRTRQIRENGPDGGRPCMTLDRTNQYILQVVNDGRQNKPGPTFLPSSQGARQEVAKALDGIARNIEYQSRAQIAYDTALEYAARCGIGWMRVTPVTVNAALNHQEIRIQRIGNPLSVVCDPDWMEPDGNDIQFGFVETMMTEGAFKKRWPKAKMVDFESANRTAGWVQDDKKLRICEYFDLVTDQVSKIIIELPDGTRQTVEEDKYWQMSQQLGYKPMFLGQYMDDVKTVKWRTMNGQEFIEETDFPSCYIPLIPVIGNELYIEDKRYLCGMTRRMMEAQRAYNYERSAWVEAVALQPKAPYLIAAESVESHEQEWARANRSNQAYLPFNAFSEDGQPIPPPRRSEPPQIPAAFAQGAQFADNDLQNSVGMYRANIGAPSNETSGRAINARQREGDTANFHYIDNLSRSIEHLWRVVLDMIPRIYDTARETRILGEDGSAKTVVIDPEGSAYEEREDGSTTINLGTGVYDVRVKTGPAYTTLREEASEHLSQIMTNPQLAPVVGPIWARMQDWPESDKLSKALLAMAPPPVQQALNEGTNDNNIDALKAKLQQQEAQMQQMGQAMQQATMQLQQLQSDKQDEATKALIEAAKLETEQYNAITNRLKVVGVGATAEQMAQISALVEQTLSQAMAQAQDMDGTEEVEQKVNPEPMEAPDMQPEQAEPMAQQAQEPQPEPPAEEMTDEQLLGALK